MSITKIKASNITDGSITASKLANTYALSTDSISAGTYANTAIANASSASLYANTGITIAQASFNAANNVMPQIQPAFDAANSASLYANTGIANAASASAYANTGINNAASASLYANTKVSKSGDTITGPIIISNTGSGALQVAGTVTISQDLNVTGNIFLSGSATTISSNNLTLSDPLVYLAVGNVANTADIGIVGHVTNGHYYHTGMVRDHLDGTWKFFSNVTSEPSTTINFGEANTVYDVIRVGGVVSPTLTSTIATGTAPFTVTSTTAVANLNIGGNAATATSATNLTGSGTVSATTTGGAGLRPSGISAWPIGSVFIAVVETNPNILLGGGTWAAFGAGRVMVGLDAAQSEFNVVEEVGGAKTHTLSTAELASHNHIQDAHNHTQNAHNHIQDAHNHTQNAHNHIQDAHSHSNNMQVYANVGNVAASQTNLDDFPGSGGPISATGMQVGAMGGGINNTTATNQATTSTNNTATATNQATTSTNNTATATNQAAGGGTAHNNLQPYIVCYFWKRVS